MHIIYENNQLCHVSGYGSQSRLPGAGAGAGEA